MSHELSFKAEVILLTIGRIIGWSIVTWLLGLVGSIIYFVGIIVILLIALMAIALEIQENLSEPPVEKRQVRRANRKRPKNADPHRVRVKYRTGRRYR